VCGAPTPDDQFTEIGDGIDACPVCTKAANDTSVTVATIVRDYLKAHGFDGIFNVDDGCDCGAEDLCPCSTPMDQCRPGVKVVGEDGFWRIEARQPKGSTS
jgi:hypothetical protein